MMESDSARQGNGRRSINTNWAVTIADNPQKPFRVLIGNIGIPLLHSWLICVPTHPQSIGHLELGPLGKGLAWQPLFKTSFDPVHFPSVRSSSRQ